jgi:hypothetical protein
MLFAHSRLVAGEENQVVGSLAQEWLPIGATQYEWSPEFRVMTEVLAIR